MCLQMQLHKILNLDWSQHFFPFACVFYVLLPLSINSMFNRGCCWHLKATVPACLTKQKRHLVARIDFFPVTNECCLKLGLTTWTAGIDTKHTPQSVTSRLTMRLTHRRIFTRLIENQASRSTQSQTAEWKIHRLFYSGISFHSKIEKKRFCVFYKDFWTLYKANAVH